MLAARTVARKPRRLKESRAAYTTAPVRHARFKTTEFEFHIVLPASADTEAFTDKLIAPGESYGGSIEDGHRVSCGFMAGPTASVSRSQSEGEWVGWKRLLARYKFLRI
ncbi:MAG: hypothetical protein NZM11_04170 [Anaerolineales bacterium]|nr:hypothetical protein [Anaerolineales bacterium]